MAKSGGKDKEKNEKNRKVQPANEKKNEGKKSSNKNEEKPTKNESAKNENISQNENKTSNEKIKEIERKNISSRSRHNPVVLDERFKSLQSSKTFQSIKPKETKLKLDDRFSKVLMDNRFQLGVTSKVDKYGRKQHNSKEERAREISKFYINQKNEKAKSENLLKNENVENKLKYLNLLSRGEIEGGSSSSLSSEDEGEIDSSQGSNSSDVSTDERNDEIYRESTNRLAVLNCDWENMKAVDLFVLMTSFCPNKSTVLSVSIYQTNYGKQKMKEEEKYGPTKTMQEIDIKIKRRNRKIGIAKGGTIVEREKAGIVIDNEDDELDQEVIRAYEVQKLKYYVAIVDCTSIPSAEVLFREIDGMEFETSRVSLEMQFVPPEQSFEGIYRKDFAKEVPADYQPPNFIFKAKQMSKVECTWDETPVDRLKLLAGSANWNNALSKGNDPEQDFSMYLVNSSTESESNSESSLDREKKISKAKIARKMLLKNSGILSDESQSQGSVSEFEFMPSESKADELMEKLKAKEIARNETPFEKMQRQISEKRSRKRKEKKLLKDENPVEDEISDGIDEISEKSEQSEDMNEEISEGSEENSEKEEISDKIDGKNYDLKALIRLHKNKSKKLRGKRKKNEKAKESVPGLDFTFDFEDKRFSAVLEGDSRFGIDPNSGDFKLTETMEKIVKEISKRRKVKIENDRSNNGVDASGRENGKREWKHLVEKLKRKDANGTS